MTCWWQVRQSWMSVPNVMATHPIVVEMFHSKPQIQTHSGAIGKDRWLTEVIRLHPLGTLNVCTEFNGNSSTQLMRYFRQSQTTDRPTSQEPRWKQENWWSSSTEASSFCFKTKLWTCPNISFWILFLFRCTHASSLLAIIICCNHTLHAKGNNFSSVGQPSPFSSFLLSVVSPAHICCRASDPLFPSSTKDG